MCVTLFLGFQLFFQMIVIVKKKRAVFFVKAIVFGVFDYESQ